MRIIKKTLCALLVVIGLAAQASASSREIYVEGYFGAGVAPDAEMDFSNPTIRNPLETIGHKMPGDLDNPFFLGGVKIGAWFEKDSWLDRMGLLGCRYKEWMQYFGLYFDIGYQRLDFRKQTGLSIDNEAAMSPNIFKSKGDVFTVAFMFVGRGGLLKDAAVPFGRLQPYLGLGPAILITSQRPSMIVDVIAVQGGPFFADQKREYGVSAALEVEPGLRWMLSRSLSLDISFKYRYSEPSLFCRFTPNNAFAAPGSMKLEPDYHLSSGQIGVAYHF